MREFILDTDLGCDSDDIGALALLNYYHNHGKIKLLCVTSVSSLIEPAKSIEIINKHYFNDIPVGMNKSNNYGYKDTYAKDIVNKYHGYSDEFEEAVTLLKKTLKDSNGDVTLVSIGPLTNIANLLKDPEGMSLVKEKVSKMYSMLGKFTEQSPEWNVNEDIESSKYVIDNFPCELVLVPFEVGCDVFTARNVLDTDTPMGLGYRNHNHGVRQSWDPITAYLAVNENCNLLEKSNKGTITCDINGVTKFTEGDGNHYYIKECKNKPLMEKQLDKKIKPNDKKIKLTERAKKEEVQFYLYIMPWIIGFLLFTLVPLVSSIYFSLFDFSKLDLAMGNKLYFVGLANYKEILKDKVFFIALKNTFFYSFVRVLLGCAISFIFAVLLNKKIWGKKLFRVLIYIPAIIPIVGSAIVWKGLFDERFSFFNFLLSIIGVAPIDWLGNNAMGSVLFMSIWCGIGPTMIIILAALQTVPQDLIEASTMDGATPIQSYLNIVLPTISPTILYVLLTGFISTLQAYAEFDLVTGGGPGYNTTTMSMLVIRAMDNEGLGYACSMAWIIFFIVLIFTLLFFRFMKGKVFYREGD